MNSHWHGLAKYPFPINDPQCSVCNADGSLNEPEITTTRHWCPKGMHGYRCSHLVSEVCLGGNGSEQNCPEHGGPKRHLMKSAV
jgi:hypothetical protein